MITYQIIESFVPTQVTAPTGSLPARQDLSADKAESDLSTVCFPLKELSVRSLINTEMLPVIGI